MPQTSLKQESLFSKSSLNPFEKLDSSIHSAMRPLAQTSRNIKSQERQKTERTLSGIKVQVSIHKDNQFIEEHSETYKFDSPDLSHKKTVFSRNQAQNELKQIISKAASELSQNKTKYEPSNMGDEESKQPKSLDLGKNAFSNT